MLKPIGQNLGALFARASGIIGDLIRELTGLAAVGLIAYGVWVINPPFGFITGGILLLAGTILLAMKR
jgi:hypothetical protein